MAVSAKQVAGNANPARHWLIIEQEITMAKSRTFWLTRDMETEIDETPIWIWAFRCYPQLEAEGIWMPKEGAHGYSHEECPQDNINIIGITLKPGEKIKCKLVLGE